MIIRFDLDGTATETDVAPGTTLMEALRALGATSVKDGCSHGDCGTCAVLVDGRAIASCLMFAAQVDGSSIETVAGMAGEEGLHPLQSALLDAGAVQCGFCTPGILLTAAELLRSNPRPDEARVRTALAGNLCRCTGYVKILEGVLLAADRLAEAEGGS
jgi:carbon-monoxide dehydrogenase small subunit